MSTLGHSRHVATLWRLTWGDASLSCQVYRSDAGFHMSVESPAAIIVAERFEFEPRAVARAHALREALRRRGWVESAERVQPDLGTPPPSA